MPFIELTSALTGRTIIVRVGYIGVVSAYVKDDAGEQYTKIRLGTNEDDVLHVVESPEEIYRRITLQTHNVSSV